MKLKVSRSTGWYVIATLALFCTLVAAIAIYGVNFPVWDQWDTPGLMFVKQYYGDLDLSEGKFSLRYWLAQHNESRKLFPRLLLVSLAALTDWNVKVEMYLIAGFIAAIAVELYWLSRLTLTHATAAQHAGLGIVANLLIFSLIQYDNFLFGLQVCVLLSLWAIVTGLLVAQMPWRMRRKVAACIVLCGLSTYSFSNGLLSWFVLAPALFLPRSWTWQAWRSRLVPMLVWAGAIAVNLGLYFRYYFHPPGHPDLKPSLLRGLHYLVIFLGRPLGENRLDLSAQVGVGVLLAAVGLTLPLLWQARRDPDRLFRAKGWLMLGAYAVISGSVAVLGRSGLGVAQAMSPRYTTFSLYAIVAAIYVGAIGLEDRRSAIGRRLLPLLLFAVLGVGLVLHADTTKVAINGMRARQELTRQGQACVELMFVVRDGECLTQRVYPLLDRLEEHAIAVNGLGYLNPPLLATTDVRQFAATEPKDATGEFEAATLEGDRLRVRARAILLRRRSPADVLLLSYTTATGEARAWAIADVRESRGDLDLNGWTGWNEALPLAGLPSGKQTLHAWGFDGSEARAYRLPGAFEIVVP